MMKDYTGFRVTQCERALLTEVPAGPKLMCFLDSQDTPRHNVYCRPKRVSRASIPGPTHTPHLYIYTSSPTRAGSDALFIPLPADRSAGPARLESCPWISLN